MPNWIKNVVRFHGSKQDKKSVYERIRTERGGVSFENIIPMELEDGDDWYSWSVEHWGTKWDANQSEIDSDGMTFETAWAMPKPFFVELSKTFPTVAFEILWADEDTGYNCGAVTMQNGEAAHEVRPDYGSADAYGMAFAIWNECDSSEIRETMEECGRNRDFINEVIKAWKKYKKEFKIGE